MAIVISLALGGFSAAGPRGGGGGGQVFFPGGVFYGRGGARFRVIWWSGGPVTAVKDDGTLQPFVEDAALVSSVAVKVDAQRQRLLVTNASWRLNVRGGKDTLGKLAGLGIYNLLTGKPIAYVDLGALRPDLPHFARDVALVSVGNAYITYSLSPVIYQVDPNGKASIFVEDKRLTSKGRSPISLVYHPDGYLIVGIPDSGALFKISLANPQEFSQIAGIPKFLGVNSMVL